MPSYMVDPLSRLDIRRYANSIRKSIGLDNTLYFPVLQLLEALPEVYKSEGFNYLVVEDREMPTDVHAEYVLDGNCIFVKNSVYEGAYAGVGRDRMTVAHEISHFLLLKQSGIHLYRSMSQSVPAYRDPEWQAMCLAGEMLVPAHLVKGMDAATIARTCGVSFDAAAYQLKKINGR